MASASVRLDLASAAQLRKITQPIVVRDMHRRALRVTNRAKVLAPVAAGTLRSRIFPTVDLTGDGPVGRVTAAVPYSLFVHEGTGLYGPRHEVIRPKTKKILRWAADAPDAQKTSAAGQRDGYAHATFVRGMKPRPFLRDALPAAT